MYVQSILEVIKKIPIGIANRFFCGLQAAKQPCFIVLFFIFFIILFFLVQP